MSQQIKNYCIAPGLFKLDGGAMFGIIPKPLWNKVAPADELNRIELDLRLWLIIDGNRKILIDTGIGDYHGGSFDERFAIRQSPNPLSQTLADLGIALEEITDLILSHLHFDHVGGLTKKTSDQYETVFPNALLHIHQNHFEYSQNPTQRDAGSFHSNVFTNVIKDCDALKKVHWLTGEQGEILTFSNGEKLNFICSHGHTPFLMHPYSEKFIYLADLIPTSNHISIPWVMGYDIAPGVSTKDKEKFLNFVMDNNLKIIFEHDPLYWGCDITKDAKKGFLPKNLFTKPSLKENRFDHIIEI